MSTSGIAEFAFGETQVSNYVVESPWSDISAAVIRDRD